jgi:hypothetical protein
MLITSFVPKCIFCFDHNIGPRFFSADNHQPESSSVLAELENIDTQADKLNIAFVKICDLVPILRNSISSVKILDKFSS